MGIFETRKIIKVDLLGVTTGFETKVLATYNFPVYDFLIHYNDGTTEHKRINADSGLRKLEIDKLLKYTKTENPAINTVAPVETQNQTRSKSAIYDDLKKVKDLFDAGILTETAYEKEKNSLLNELNGDSTSTDKKTSSLPYNLIIRRQKKRPFGEQKIMIVLDSQMREELDTDSEIQLSITPGPHHIQFRRGSAAKSPEYTIQAQSDSVVTITILAKTVGLLGLQADIQA